MTFLVKKECWKNTLITLLAIILSTSSLVVITRCSMELYFTLLAIVCIACVIIFIRRELKVKYLRTCIVLSCIIFISIVLNQDFSIINLAYVFLPWFAMLFFQIVERKQFSKYYCNWMAFLAVYSLVAHYILMIFFPGIIDMFRVGVNSGGFPVYDFIFAFRYVGSVSRNTGIFREMGEYAVYLNFALYFLLFEVKNDRFKIIKLIVFVVTIISTLSTPGIIAMIMLLVAAIIQILVSRSVKEWKGLMKISVILMGCLIVIYICAPIVRGYVLSAFQKLNQGGSSFQGRTESIKVFLQVWITHPLFGSAYTNTMSAAKMIYEKLEIGVLHNTSSNTSILSMYGISYFVLLYYYPVKNILKKNMNSFTKIVAFLGIVMLCECQYVILDTLFWVILFYFMDMEPKCI